MQELFLGGPSELAHPASPSPKSWELGHETLAAAAIVLLSPVSLTCARCHRVFFGFVSVGPW